MQAKQNFKGQQHLQILDEINNPSLNQKYLDKKENTLRDIKSNFDLLKTNNIINLNATDPNSINYSQMSSFVGRRLQSPQPTILEAQVKTPLKLLHYHKK